MPNTNLNNCAKRSAMNRNKFVWFISLLVMLAAILSSANFHTDNNRNEGIQFFEGTWKEAVTKSKAENKPIFLDVYATWCGPCKMLERYTFSDKKVGAFFNANYINVSLDGEEAEGLRLMQKYNLHAYPSLLVIDQEENAKAVATGFMSPKNLVDFGKGILRELNR
jgi:thioredoxin